MQAINYNALTLRLIGCLLATKGRAEVSDTVYGWTSRLFPLEKIPGNVAHAQVNAAQISAVSRLLREARNISIVSPEAEPERLFTVIWNKNGTVIVKSRKALLRQAASLIENNLAK